MIVGSILLAFGIDAAWEGRQERVEERLALEALGAEFDESVRGLTVAHRIQVEFAEKSGTLDSLLTEGARRSTIHVIDSLLTPLVAFRTPDPATGSLSMLLASGRIDLIRNSELQQALAGWPSMLEDSGEDERLVRDFVQEQLIPGLVEQMDLTGMMAGRTSEGLATGRAYVLTGREYEIRVSPTSRSLIAHRAYLARTVVGGSRARLDAAEAILSLIESELQG